jgi:hypothetical protein
MSNERIDIESMEARMRLWAIGDVSDEDLALELDYIVPELKRCYEEIDRLAHTVSCYLRAIEIFDPKGKHDDLSYAIQQAFDE